MRILDRERYWSFLKAYVICFVALVGLYVVIHAFSNIDEFMQVARGTALLAKMGRYYLVNMSQFYDRLCGIITMMAAIFTVTWVQKDNELLAMLAAGIGTKRVIRPVLVSALIVNVLAVANQEYILPIIAEELQRDPADHAGKVLQVSPRLDQREISVGGRDADRLTSTVFKFAADFPIGLVGGLGGVEARQARYIPPGTPNVPMSGGWLLRGVRLKLMEDAPLDPAILVKVGPEELKRFPPPAGDAKAQQELIGDAYHCSLRLLPSLKDSTEIPATGKDLIVVATVNNLLCFRIFDADGKLIVDTDERSLLEKAAKVEDLRARLASLWPPRELTGGEKSRIISAVTSLVGFTHAYFFRTNVSFEVVTRNRAQWYRFAATPDLIRAIADPACKPERDDISIFLHGRLMRPLMSMALLMVSLPLVLGGDGRNMFINLGLSLGTSAAFYAASFVAQYLAGNAVLSPEMSAWAPFIGFAAVAVARWDTIRT